MHIASHKVQAEGTQHIRCNQTTVKILTTCIIFKVVADQAIGAFANLKQHQLHENLKRYTTATNE
jgi:hypothetical protein